MPHLEKLQAELKGEGLRVLAINIEGDALAVKHFAARRHSKLTMLVDTGRIARKYGVQTLPHVAVVDRAGKMIYVQTGSRGVKRLKERLMVALKKKP